jgi:hypothetical protein
MGPVVDADVADLDRRAGRLARRSRASARGIGHRERLHHEVVTADADDSGPRRWSADEDHRQVAHRPQATGDAEAVRTVSRFTSTTATAADSLKLWLIGAVSLGADVVALPIRAMANASHMNGSSSTRALEYLPSSYRPSLLSATLAAVSVRILTEAFLEGS